MTPEFFDATAELNTIYRWARARYAAPWAVFGAVLLRVAASTGPEVQLPGLIGGRASLNLLCAFVAPSGGGKGISDKVARLAWPTEIIERPIGSGEGIAALLAPPKKEGAERITRAILHAPEIDTMAGIAARQGSILLAQLKSMAMAELLGQTNASDATTRLVPAHSYRACLSVGAQPGHCGVIFSDTSGGTPQRFLWFPTTDPDMPAEAPTDPDPLNTALPDWARTSGDVVEIQYGPAEIAQTVIAAHLARQRGEADALDGHALLTRCKVAAVLAIMHHRSVVSDLDWQLSEQVMAVSDATRQWVLDEAKRAERARVRERAIARAVGEDFYDNSRLETVKRSLLRMLERDGEQQGNVLRSRLGRKEKRELFDQAIGLLEAEGLVSQIPGMQKGARYRLSGQGDHGGRGAFSQVNHPDHVGQGDQPGTVTELDSRRSHESEPTFKSCGEWLAHHRQQLLDSGQTTTDGFAVRQAGRAAGYSDAAISMALHQAPEWVATSRRGGQNRTATYDLTGSASGYRSAEELVREYLDTQVPANTDVIDKDHFAQWLPRYVTYRRAERELISCGRVAVERDPKNATKTIWRVRTATDGDQGATA